MTRTPIRPAAVAAVALLALVANAPAGTTVDLEASADNTLYGGAIDLSNGVGDHFFTGRTGGGDGRRAVIAFDIAGTVPAGATITGATLTLYMSRTVNGSQAVALHRVTNSWGEGLSHAPKEEGGGGAALDNDATWAFRFYNEADPYASVTWDTEGGDFAGTASASTNVSGIGYYVWSAPAMISNVQAWLDDPAQDHGWIVIGNEAAGGFTAKRFDSRTNPFESRRPVLSLTYDEPVCDGDLDGSGDVGFGDILQIIGAWGELRSGRSDDSARPVRSSDIPAIPAVPAIPAIPAVFLRSAPAHPPRSCTRDRRCPCCGSTPARTARRGPRRGRPASWWCQTYSFSNRTTLTSCPFRLATTLGNQVDGWDGRDCWDGGDGGDDRSCAAGARMTPHVLCAVPTSQ
ncbi:MAG: DNRLRE domain-containing protein, partial [Planctomycetota bacterium]